MPTRTIVTVVLVACSNSGTAQLDVRAQDVAVYEATLEALPLPDSIYLETHLLLRRPNGQPHLGGADHVEPAPSLTLQSVAERGDYVVCIIRSDDGCHAKRGTYVAMSDITRLPNGQFEVGVAENSVFVEGGAVGGRTWIVRLEGGRSRSVISKRLVYTWDGG